MIVKMTQCKSTTKPIKETIVDLLATIFMSSKIIVAVTPVLVSL